MSWFDLYGHYCRLRFKVGNWFDNLQNLRRLPYIFLVLSVIFISITGNGMYQSLYGPAIPALARWTIFCTNAFGFGLNVWSGLNQLGWIRRDRAQAQAWRQSIRVMHAHQCELMETYARRLAERETAAPQAGEPE